MSALRHGRILLKFKIAVISFIIIVIFLIDYFGLLLHFFEIDYSKFSYPLDAPMDEILIALKQGNKPKVTPINEFNYRYCIKNDIKCLQSDTNSYEKVIILFVIKSALYNNKRREVIRKTWGSETRFSDVNIKRIFLIGKTNDLLLQDLIDKEYHINKDLIQADFVDSYYNNTMKTIMGFKWVVHHCPKAQFIMFADDDMFISAKNLLKFIHNPFNTKVGFRRKRGFNDMTKSNEFTLNDKILMHNASIARRQLFQFDPILSAYDGRLMAGYVFFSSPMRHKSSKWYISLSDYPYSKYPPYVTAGAYILSYPALEDLYYTSMFTKTFKFDDVYLGIIAKKCGISPLHNEHFFFWKKPYNKEAYRNVIASHGYNDPNELLKIWNEQHNLGYA